MERIVIKHLNGVRSNQEESFPLSQFSALTIGRDPSCDVKFDPTADVVSRNHARIERDATDPSKFRLVDNRSTNGIFVNGARVTGTVDIRHGDVVRLGPDGPEFSFRFDPPPVDALKATRVVDLGAASKATRVSTLPATAAEAPGPAQRGVGRETVERMLTVFESSSRKRVVNWIAAVIGVVVLVTGGLVWYQKREAAKTTGRFAAEEEQRKQEQSKRFDATRIAAEYGGSTVYIEASWKLVDNRSKKTVYHQFAVIEPAGGKGGRTAIPLYIRLANGVIEPRLTLNDKSGVIVGGSHTGSGFVVTDNGFILTNRHVAAAWFSGGGQFLPLPGILIKVDQEGTEIGREPFADTPENRAAVAGWIPAHSFQGGGSAWDRKNLIGENQYFDVTFAKSKTRTPARIVKISDEADTALIKIDTPKALTPVRLTSGESYQVKQGEPVVTLGYPGVSPKVFVRTASQDAFVNTAIEVVVPDNTVSLGAIGRLIPGTQTPVGGTRADYRSQVGDTYQLTINSTGPGNSGGPTFNAEGRVIGILSSGGGGITFATPIKYGLDLMDTKPVIR